MKTNGVVIAGLLWLLAVGALAGQEEADRWGAEVGLSLNSSGGNESLTVVTTELAITHLETATHEISLRGRVRYGRSEGQEVARNLRGSINADLTPARPWSPFLFVTAERDPFRRLDLRLHGGSGVKRTFWRSGWSEASLSGAVLYARDQIRVPDAALDVNQTARWSWRGRVRHQVREGTRLQQVVFFQPAWDHIGDYQMEAQTTARVSLSQTLALTSNFLFQRDSRPALDVAPDDWALTVGLSLATGW
jgi:hypothetical protein